MKHLSLCKWTEKTKYNTNTHLQLFCPNFPTIRKIGNSILFTIILLGLGQVCWGQVNGDYQSKGIDKGNWSTPGTWQVYNNGWIEATVPPTKDNDVTIQSGHTITLNTDGFVKTLKVSGILKLTTNTGFLLSVYGDFLMNGTFTYASGTVSMCGSTTQKIGDTKAVTFNNLTIANTAGVIANKNISIKGTMKISKDCSFDLASSLLVTGSATANLTGEGTVNVTAQLSASDGDGDYLMQYSGFNAGRDVSIVKYSGTEDLAQVISSIVTYSDIIISNSAGCTLFNVAQCKNLTISVGVLTVAAGGTLTVTGITDLDFMPAIPDPPAPTPCLILKSDESSTGSFIYNTFGTGTGTLKVERYMSHTNNWHLYSSPIKYSSASPNVNLSIHDFLKYNPEIPDLVDPQSSNTVIGVGMRKYLTSTDVWDAYLKYGETDNGDIISGIGYSIRTYNDAQGTGTIDATGIPHENTVSVSLSRTAATTDKGWNCIGNPFTSAIRVNNTVNEGFLNTGNLTNLDDSFTAVYIWDTNNITSDRTQPEYIALNNSSTDITSVQIGQGFFVKSKEGGGSVTFSKGMQVPSAGLSFKSAELVWPSISIVAQSKTLSSSTKIKFITNTTKGLDRGYDAGMLKANPDFALYSKLLVDNAVDFTIQCLPDQNYDQYVIPIGLDCKVAGDITFTAETINLPSGCQALLEDRLTKRFTRLDLKDAKYTAAVSADTKGTGRFYLHTSDVISSTQPIENQLFKIYETGKTVYINGDVSENAKFFVYSVNGKQLANFSATSLVQNQFDATGLPAGVYILSINDKNQSKSVKFVIEN